MIDEKKVYLFEGYKLTDNPLLLYLSHKTKILALRKIRGNIEGGTPTQIKHPFSTIRIIH